MKNKDEEMSLGQDNGMYVIMLGEFKITYNGQSLNLGHNQTTKAMKLLQLLLFSGESGIHRSQIVQYLFGVDAEGSIQGNLRVIVHNLRKILEKSGLPQGDYIKVQAGVYRFAADFNITVDVLEFESYIHRAKSMHSEEAYELYKKACEVYKGHFLPEIYGEDWVVVNSSRLQRLYSETTAMLAEKLKSEGQYEELRKLANHAAVLCPLEEWQVYEIEALIALGNTKEAFDLYDKTAAMYFEELMIPPSENMLESFRHMKERIQMQTSDIDEIQLYMDEKEFLKGAFFCQYPSFVDSYRMMSRMMERSGQSVFLIMCTLYDEREQLTEELEPLKKLSAIVFEAIQKSLRRGDVFTKYNLKQFLIMVTGIRGEECSIVTGRIDSNFRKIYTNKKVKLHFYVSSVAANNEK